MSLQRVDLAGSIGSAHRERDPNQEEVRMSMLTRSGHPRQLAIGAAVIALSFIAGGVAMAAVNA